MELPPLLWPNPLLEGFEAFPGVVALLAWVAAVVLWVASRHPPRGGRQPASTGLDRLARMVLIVEAISGIFGLALLLLLAATSQFFPLGPLLALVFWLPALLGGSLGIAILRKSTAEKDDGLSTR